MIAANWAVGTFW